MTLQHKDPGQQTEGGCPEYRKIRGFQKPDGLIFNRDEDGSQDVFKYNDGMDAAKL